MNNKIKLKIKKIFLLFVVVLITLPLIFLIIKNFPEQSNTVHLTRSSLDSYQKSLSKTTFRAPDFKEKSLFSDVPSSKKYNPETGKYENIVVWDSWPVTDSKGNVANYHGYRLVIGLTATEQRSDGSGTKMGLYAQKISDKSDDISSWKYLGDVFNTFTEGENPRSKDAYLSKTVSEWSGSTMMLKSTDSTLRLFYTNAILTPAQSQALTTAQISVEPKNGKDWNSGLVINHQKATDHKTIFVGDGDIYQRVDQLTTHGDYADQFAMRDPQMVIDNGKYYLTFAANTGNKDNPQGQNNISNRFYYGNYFDYKKSRSKLEKSDKFNMAYLSNASLGLVELNTDFTVKKVMKPILTANNTSDQLERPTIIHYDGKWYMFTCTWGVEFATSDPKFANQQFMLGYVSDNGINGKYKPLNGNGLVLATQKPKSSYDLTYAFLVVPSKENKKGEFVVTSFLANKTFAPSYLLKIKGDKTEINNNIVLDQGALYDTGKYYKASPQSFD